MARKLKSDRLLFLTTILLVGLSVLMVYSATSVRYQQEYVFLTKQLMWAALGISLLWIVMKIDYRVYRHQAFIWTTFVGVALCLAAVLLMPAHNGARRWFGFGGLGIQPSEPAKLVVIVFVAALLERRMHRIDDIKFALAPIGLAAALIGLIVIEPDLGTSMTLALVVFVMVVAAGISYTYVAALVLAAIPAAAALVWMFPHAQARMLSFRDPWKYELTGGYQLIHSLLAIGTGGVTGKGLGGSLQKMPSYLPEAHTDFIYSIIAEEWGLLGATLIVCCFLLIAWRGLRVSLRAPDRFGAFLALGLTAMLVIQAFVNISVVMGLVPTKGIPLPFVSFGGSSLLVACVGMGMLLNVSQHASADA